MSPYPLTGDCSAPSPPVITASEWLVFATLAPVRWLLLSDRSYIIWWHNTPGLRGSVLLYEILIVFFSAKTTDFYTRFNLLYLIATHSQASTRVLLLQQDIGFSLQRPFLPTIPRWLGAKLDIPTKAFLKVKISIMDVIIEYQKTALETRCLNGLCRSCSHKQRNKWYKVRPGPAWFSIIITGERFARHSKP